MTIDGNMKSEIGKGLLVLLGICDDDNEEDIDWLVRKIVQLRVFDDENGVMNRSVTDIQGEIMVVSQFTLYASYKKGNRPMACCPSILRYVPVPYSSGIRVMMSLMRGPTASG